MTRKDYVAFAKMLNQTIRDYDDSNEALSALQRVTRESADLFVRDNPNFDAARFFAECFKGTRIADVQARRALADTVS